MIRSNVLRTLASCVLLSCVLTGCTRDPNARKQKYFDSGEKYFAQEKYREAAIQYSNALQIDPRFAQAHFQLSQSFLRIGDSQRAFQELTRTVELAPDNYRAHVDLANLLMTVRAQDGSPDSETLKQAKVHLDLLREKQPNSAETHQAWSNYYATQNKLPDAIREMQQAIALDPSRSDPYVMLALLQLRSNQLDASEASLKKAIAVDPKSLNAQLALGTFYQSHGRILEAEQQFRHTIEVDPKSADARASLVRVLLQEGKKDEIEPFLQKTRKDLTDDPQGYRMLGDYYFAEGDLDKALNEYASIYSEYPKDVTAKKNYIQLLILKNRVDEASKLTAELLKANPNDSDSLIYKGEIQMRQNDAAGAIQSFQSALKNDAGNAVAHFQLGNAHAQQKDSSRAESEWREAVRLRPSLIEAQHSLAAVELDRADYGALLQTAQQIITYQPSSPDGLLLKAVAEMAQQKFADAQRDTDEAMQRAPDSAAPLVQMGNIQFAQKHLADAEKYYRQALDKNPSSNEALSGLVNTYTAQKQFDKAISATNGQINKSPNNSGFYYLLGSILFAGKKDYSGAEAVLRKAIDLDKDNVDAIEKLGKVETEAGQPDQALALYLQATKDHPREVRFYIFAGQIYSAQQNWDQARFVYQQALNISPDNPIASNDLAYVILQQGGNVDVAMNMAQTARRAMPDSPNAADTLGWAYYQKGIYQSAIGQFQEALRLNEKSGAPDNASVHYHLGLAYEKTNQPSLARQHLEKAVKINPDNPEARKALSQLRG
jgi:tetratricopeptide (TPR) repeat protein